MTSYTQAVETQTASVPDQPAQSGVGAGAGTQAPAQPTTPATAAPLTLKMFWLLSGFATVTVTVVDEDGNRVEDARYVYSRQDMLTGGIVPNGKGNVLLNTSLQYDELVVVGETTQSGVRYAWDTVGDVQTSIRPAVDDAAEIVVDPTEISTGLQVTPGVRWGGA